MLAMLAVSGLARAGGVTVVLAVPGLPTVLVAMVLRLGSRVTLARTRLPQQTG
jgi:hypothetical protein